jgi:hypothetical protein
MNRITLQGFILGYKIEPVFLDKILGFILSKKEISYVKLEGKTAKKWVAYIQYYIEWTWESKTLPKCEFANDYKSFKIVPKWKK